MNGSVTVLQMSSEMFNDALFYRERALEANISQFDRRRYLRTSLIFFCCSVESWVNKVIVHQFKKKAYLTREERDILIKLEDPDDPRGKIINIPKKLRRIFPKALGVDANNALIERYLQLSKVRNSIIHFSPGNFEDAYNENDLTTLVNEAPQIIEELMYSYYPQNINDRPNWFGDRTSRRV